MAVALCAYLPSLQRVSAAPASNSEVQPDRAEPHSNNFRDDFSGSELRPEWGVLNEDADRWTLTQDDYLLLVPAEARSNTVEVNRFIYRGSLPDNYDVILKIRGGPGRNVNIVLGIAKDESNAVVIENTGVTETQSRIIFSKIMRGEKSYFYEDIGQIKENEDYYMKISKKMWNTPGFLAAMARRGQKWVCMRSCGSPDYPASALSFEADPRRPRR
jgi:hypothetical protein